MGRLSTIYLLVLLICCITVLIIVNSARWNFLQNGIPKMEPTKLLHDSPINGASIQLRKVSSRKQTPTEAELPAKYRNSLFEGLDERIDNMEAGPLPVLDNYRTPCWYESLNVSDPYPVKSHVYLRFFRRIASVQASYRKTLERSVKTFKERLNKKGGWRLRCLPYFYLIGINRGGSTALWSSIISHPLVKQAGPRKELHYWNEIRYGANLEKMGYGTYLNEIRSDKIPRSIRSYVDVIDASAEAVRTEVIRRPNGSMYHPLCLGEGTPNYLTDFDNWQLLPVNKNLSEPKYILAHILKMLTPGVKIIVILRNPVKRLLSEYLTYRRSERKTAAQFHSLAIKAVSLMEECLANRTLRSCAYDLEIASQTQPVIVKHSLYYPFIRDWLEVFTRDEMIILRSEDYYANPTKTTNEVFRFLGLDQRHNVPKGYRNGADAFLRPYKKTVEMLQAFFKPFNKQLADLLADRKFLWNTS